MNAGLLSGKVSPSWLVRACVGMCLGILLVAGTSCKKESNPAPGQPPVQAPSNDNNSMFERMNQGGNRQERSQKSDEPAKVPVDMPEIFLGLEKSPECKALEQQQTEIRGQIAKRNKEEVAPAYQKAEVAEVAFDECQNDMGCVNNLDRYEAKHRAFQSAQRNAQSAERKVEELETELYHISQKMAARCDTDPL